MELRDLEYFVTVVETGSLTLAARRRGLSQQALSKSLARLEGELGVALLERTPKGVMVTRVGDALLTRARAVLAEVGNFRRDVDVALGRSLTHFAVGLSPVAASGVGANAIIRLQRRFPRVRIRVEAGLEERFIKFLLAGEIDMAVATTFNNNDPQIMTTPLGDIPWAVAGRQGNPLLTRAESVRDLADADWVCGKLPGGLDERVDAFFAAAGAPPIQPKVTTTSVLFFLSSLASSDMIAVLPKSVAARMPELMFRDFADGAWTTPLILMRRRRAATSQVETILADLLREEVQALSA